MNPNLHFGLCVACVVAGLLASVLYALLGGGPAVLVLAALAYGLSAGGHWTMMIHGDDTLNEWGAIVPAVFWPLLDLWLLAWVFLPPPRRRELGR